MKARVREMEENTRTGRSRRMKKNVAGCIQAVVGKKKLLVQFKDRQNRETSDSSLPCLCSKEEVDQEVYDTISDLPKRGKSELLTIYGDTVCEGDGIFEKLCIFLSISLSITGLRDPQAY